MVAHHPADRPFGGDVHGIGADGLDAGDKLPVAGDRKPDLGIGRTWNGQEIAGRHEHQLDAELRDRCLQSLIGAHDAIDLRSPGIGGDQHAHYAAASSSGVAVSRALRSRITSNQRMSWN